jgi:hypothetical protein
VSLESFLTTQDRQSVRERRGNRATAEFVDRKYPAVVDAMHGFIARAHTTITTTADGVAQAGAEYQVTEAQVEAWLRQHKPN